VKSLERLIPRARPAGRAHLDVLVKTRISEEDVCASGWGW
jgi:hypothetical protein